MTLAAHIDFETGSHCDLRKSGVHRYAEDISTRIWCLCWSLGDSPIYLWRPGDPPPQALLDHIAAGGLVSAHKADFEVTIWNVTLRRVYHPKWPPLRWSQMRCTMAQAYALSLPGGLDEIARIIGAAEQKDEAGHANMLKLSVYGRFDTRQPEPWMLDKQYSYCGQDVRTERSIGGMLAPLTPSEQALWALDKVINERGIQIDLKYAAMARQIADIARKEADRDMRRLTQGVVRKATEVGKLINWLDARGIKVESLKKGDFEDHLIYAYAMGDEQAYAALSLRREAAKTSTAKYERMTVCACADSRIRGTIEYHGAQRTGRWAGRLIQTQNFPRVDPDRDGPAVDLLVPIVLGAKSPQDAYETIRLVLGSPLAKLSLGLRSAIIAKPGHRLVGGDLANIEGRMLAELSGEAWKLEAFRRYDAGQGPDLYVAAYASSFGIEVDAVTKAQRQIGKVQELALGYQGGVGAFLSMAAVYMLKPPEIAKAVKAVVEPSLWDEVGVRYDKAKDKWGLPKEVWIGLKIVVERWRQAHPMTVQYWWDLQDAAIDAVENPGLPIQCRQSTYLSDGFYLYCQLPSGRVICYAKPAVETKIVTRVNKKGEEYEVEAKSVSFWGLQEGQWRKQHLYGGHQAENIDQATCRDILVNGMLRADALGYPLVLTVHDEILTEPPIGFGSPDELHDCMTTHPGWLSPTFPLAAKCWEDVRYMK